MVSKLAKRQGSKRFGPVAASSIMLFSLMTRPTILFILGIFSLQEGYSDEGKSLHAGLSKRSFLTFPARSLLQINMGVTLPGDFERNTAVIVLAFQQFAPLPEETQPFFTPFLVGSGKKFSIYNHLRDVISSYGFSGAGCLRKMVCELGENPLVGGLLEDIITLVLTPSRHRGVRSNDSLSESLIESEELGRRGGNCTSAYPQCVRTPLDVISTLVHF